MEKLMARENCGNCRHWNKGAYPKNDMFGRCEFVLPQMPIWAQRQIAVEFRAITRENEYCQVYSRTSGEVKHDRDFRP